MQSLFGNCTYVDQNAPKEKTCISCAIPPWWHPPVERSDAYLCYRPEMLIHHEFMGQSVFTSKKFNNQPYISGEIRSESGQFRLYRGQKCLDLGEKAPKVSVSTLSGKTMSQPWRQ